MWAFVFLLCNQNDPNLQASSMFSYHFTCNLIYGFYLNVIGYYSIQFLSQIKDKLKGFVNLNRIRKCKKTLFSRIFFSDSRKKIIKLLIEGHW